jgi:hypothetical protein
MNHLQIARIYGRMHQLSKVMVLLQPKGTHNRYLTIAKRESIFG